MEKDGEYTDPQLKEPESNVLYSEQLKIWYGENNTEKETEVQEEIPVRNI
jgi:hypothetical protein